MQQSDIHQFTRTEWNSPKKKDLWMDLCKYSKIPAV